MGVLLRKTENYSLIYFLDFYFLIYFMQKPIPEGSVRKGVLRNFAKYTGKHLSQSLFKKRDFGTGVFL